MRCHHRIRAICYAQRLWRAYLSSIKSLVGIAPTLIIALPISTSLTQMLQGEDKYREDAWSIFEAIEKRCKVTTGYGAYRQVNEPSHNENNVEDSMESYFLAETLKYLYLIFDDSNPIDLTRSVFNTEAHPLPITPDASTFTPIEHPKTPAPEDPFSLPVPPPVCEDNDGECAGWAEDGECQVNPGYMLEMCRKSCGACK